MKLPDFSLERRLWRKGFKAVAGVDEVGRGCFAGPVVAAAVAFAPIKNLKFKIKNYGIRIDDSKKLRPRQREKAAEWIKKNALAWGIGEASATLINRIGMARATNAAFRRAIINCKLSIDYLLIDAFYIPYVNGIQMPRKNARKNHASRDSRARQKAITHGDEKSLSIATASIIAKVYRDKIMLGLSKQSKYKKYGWGRNKGYGTREHQGAIRKHRLTRYHRKAFVETFLSNK